MVCNPLDLRCIFVNELAGTALVAMFLILLLYFIVASKLRFGFDTTLVMLIPFMIGFGLIIGGFQAIYAFITFIVAVLLGWIFVRFIENR